jgi:hypothetical protein
MFGVSYGEDLQNNTQNDIIRRALFRHRPDMVFLQLSPENFMARQRFLSQKSALKGVEDFDIKALSEINPQKPLTWEECVVNPGVLDMLKENEIFDKIHLPKSFYTYSNPEVQNKEGGVMLRDELIKSISKNIIGGDYSCYKLINEALYQCVMGKHKVLLGEMPEILYRQVVAGNFELDELKDIFKFLAEQLKKLIVPMSFRESAYNFLPHIFQAPKDLYMTALLKESFQATLSVVSFVGNHHVRPIQHYWKPPPNGINFTEATYIPERKRHETDEDLIEKQALLDSLLEKRAWNKKYIHNPFPYLVEDITKVNQETIKNWVDCFRFHYLKYEKFKKGYGLGKEIPFFKDREIYLIENKIVQDVNFLETQEKNFLALVDNTFVEKSKKFQLIRGSENNTKFLNN